jgi:Fic family protein
MAQPGRPTGDNESRLLPLDYEERSWLPAYNTDDLSRRERALLPSTVRSSIPVPITAIRFEIPAHLGADLEDATAAIVRLDSYTEHTLGKDDIVPMQSVLLRSESAASSQIEDLTVGARQLAIAEIGAAASHNAQLVARNVAAMDAAIRLADNLDADAILEMHRALLGQHAPEMAGRWRTRQVWIGGHRLMPVDALFVPPHADRVASSMEDLVSFLGREDLPVLAHAAIAHAQFETIHPFADGNGRTGRALIHALLRAKGLTRRVTVPISAGLLTDTATYFDALTSYRTGDVEPIIEQVAAASRRAANLGRWLVDALDALRGRWLEALPSRAGSAGRRLASVLIGQPAVNVSYVQRRLGVSYNAANRAIDQSVAAGVLTEATDKKRNRVWVARDVVDTLDEFAERAGRRNHP